MALSSDDIWSHLNSLAKPPRSLGRLEELAFQLCRIQRTISPQTRPRRLVLFAGDHGVVASGVSAWPSKVTALVARTILAGKAASTVMARELGAETVLVNVGVVDEVSEGNGEIGPLTIRYRDACLRKGSRNLEHEPALTADEFTQAIEVGRQEAYQAARDGMRLVLAGEMGIGNTTPSACLSVLLADAPISEAVGRGAGADDETLHRKRAVVHSAVDRSRRQWSKDRVSAIAGVAGFEITAIAGFFMAAHGAGLTIVLDGFVASAAALIAEQLQPGTASSMIAAHLSVEQGHRFALQHLGLQPFLDWSMRLGEGTGALLLLPLLDVAAQLTANMATLNSTGVSVGGES